MEKKLHFLSFDVHFNINVLRIVIVLAFIFIEAFAVCAQDINTKFNISAKETPLKTVLESMRKQSRLDFIYSDDEIRNYRITVSIKGEGVKETLDKILKDVPLEYRIKENRIISILPKAKISSENTVVYNIKGKVVNERKVPVEGATLIVLGTTKGAVSDGVGEFFLSAKRGDIIEVSCVGMQTNTYVVREEEKNLIIRLKEDAMAVEDVVITGIYTRKAESFTGSQSTFTAKDLKAIGGNNVLQSLKSLDPAFAMIENNEFGSDPNRLPDIEIRGKSSLIGMKDNLQADPNQPLFILDGFESDLNTIYNLDVNRIQSITLLKDAASTAIYGSKAANGVVVVETVKPKPGELRVSYNGKIDISTPDLSSYNMMNAREKLAFEAYAGKYTGSYAEKDYMLKELYNNVKRDIEEVGIDTYWMGEPLRVGVNHRHSLYVDGGSDNFQYLFGGSYNGVTGVMKKSDRENISGNIDLTYRVSKFQFSNKFVVDYSNFNNPITSFSDFVNTNPYYKKYNDEGVAEKWLYYNKDLGFQSPNPLYNDALNSYKIGSNVKFSNSFIAEWMPLPELKARVRFGLMREISKNKDFTSPDHTKYQELDPIYRGDFSSTMGDKFKYEGEIAVTYGKTFNEIHQVNAVVGGNINNSTVLTEGYSAKGFPAGNFTYPSFSNGYPEGGSPMYVDAVNRSLSVYANVGYALKNRYLVDFSYRLNGSSVFGSSKRYANTWSVGLGWNIHNENFIKNNTDGINLLKLRGSIGNPGNQNFDSFMTYTTYKYNFNNFNYFGMSAFINSLGNPNLKWQTTTDKNIGLDFTFLKNRFTIYFDYYHKYTNPLLISINVPASTGETISTTNLGNQITQGITATAIYYMIYRPQDRLTWSIRGTIRTDKSELQGIGNSLQSLNKYGQKNNTLVRYFDGANPNSLWAVRSAGINPADGREIFIKKDGTKTFDYNSADEVAIGNSRPKIEGVIGSGFKYKGFSVDISFNYRIGGYTMNYALFNKVEGISGSSMNYNQDKRALYDRWHEAGQIAKYKNIQSSQRTPISSRFIQKENTFSLESLRLGYEFDNELVSKWGMSSIQINAYTTELFRLSTIKSERGTSYPFSRSYQLALTINF